MSEFKASGFRDEFGSGGPDLVGITTLTSPYYFVPPSGSTAERPQSPPPGMLRFNTDIGRLEVWRNDHWATILGESPNLGGGTGSNTGTGTRGVFSGGYEPATISTIRYITVSTLGDTQDFGSLALGIRRGAAACASRTRGIVAGGANVSGVASQSNHVEFFTFASTGNTTDFVTNLTNSTRDFAGLSNQTRGLFAGGYTGPNNTSKFNNIDAIEIAQTGTKIDFGDLAGSTCYGRGIASSIRGIFLGGVVSPNTADATDVMQYVTISSTGNTQDFGDLSAVMRSGFALSNPIRGLYAGGSPGPGANVNTIDFITMASTGNTQDFGDLTVAGANHPGASSPTRAVFGPGSSRNTTMDYVEIMTTGNAVDFGDSPTNANAAGCSNGHGGL
jgi:hypothetical protein